MNERISRFAAIMDEVDPRPDKLPPKVGLALTREEQATFLDALGGPLYRKSCVCKPVLQRLDEALSSGGAIYEDPTSIEHVLPQTVDADSEWAHGAAKLKLRDEVEQEGSRGLASQREAVALGDAVVIEMPTRGRLFRRHERYRAALRLG